MILVGAWLAILGYGVMYAGVYKLAHSGQGVQCSLRDAFTGTCTAGGSNVNTSLTAAPTPPQQPSALPNEITV